MLMGQGTTLKTSRGVVILVMATLLLPCCGGQERAASPDSLSVPTRIVSLSPALTEMLFAVGAGDRVVGVTRFCKHPPEAQERAPVGGFFDPNYEALIGLTPDLILLTPSHADAAEQLDKLALRYEAVRHESLDDIAEGLVTIGRLCGEAEAARALALDFRARIARVERAVSGRPRPRVMLVVGRDYGSPSIDQVYISGVTGLHGELVRLAGGENAYQGGVQAHPMLSPEGILSVNPDVIVELAPGFDAKDRTADSLKGAWDSLAVLDAVREGRLHALTGDHVSIPGPRIVAVLEELGRILHPEVDWDGV